MNADQAKNYAAMLAVLVSLGEQIALVTATLQAAQAAGRDVTDDEVSAARAAAVQANEALATA